MALQKSAFKIPKSEQENVIIWIVDTPCTAEGLSLTTWSSAGILSNLLYKLGIDRSQLKQDGEGYGILELGAGTGLSGLTAAIVWGSSALLTDLPTIVPGVQANVDLNIDTLRQHGASAACGTLDWTKPDTIHLPPTGKEDARTFTVDDVDGFPVILAADTSKKLSRQQSSHSSV